MFEAVQDIPVFPKLKGLEISIVPVESVAKAHILAEKKLCDVDSVSTVAGKAYNICDQKVVVTEFVEFVASEKKSSVLFVPFSLVYLIAWLNEKVYRMTGIVLLNEALFTLSVGYKSHTYASDLARRELGWGPSQPWQEAVRELLKRKQQKESDSKKDK